MFTGIVEELGEVVALERLTGGDAEAVRLRVRGPLVTTDVAAGDSIAVNGVCLTVVEASAGEFTADVMRETLVRTSLGTATAGSPVNLERAVTLSTRLGGHLVQGHVDGTGELLDRTRTDHWDVLRISLPGELAPLRRDQGIDRRGRCLAHRGRCR